MEEPEDSIVEQRKELTVSPTGGNPFLKNAFFLKPISTTDEPCSKIIPLCSIPSSHFEPNTTLRVKIRGWPQGQEDWKAWVDQMAPLHQSTWKKAGIYDAIFNSTYQIKRHTNLVCGFAAKWCSETNTFIFPWGEATITLEDAMVLGGYSVLGNSVSSPPESTELGAIERKLIEGRKEIYRSGASHVLASLWQKKFMNSGSEIEHEAFLVYWLSRYVFLGDSSGKYVIQSNAFSIAAHLARGTRIALAPAVLASIYRDLGLLKKAIVNSNQLKLGTNTTIDQEINSTFHLVQIWAWERFSDLRPQNPKSIIYGEPRMARWDNVDCRKVKNMRMVLDSAGENFLWRPYASDVIGNCHLPKYYPQKEMWVLRGPDLDEELLSFASCLKISELVGFGTNNVELYLPHRVAMQFGYDQDVPCPVTLPNSNSGLALEPENNEMNNVRLHIPSRLSEAHVSTKYLKWWKQSVSGLGDGVATAVQQRKRTRIHERILLRANHTPVHSAHPPKHKRKEAEDPMDENDEKLTISEFKKCTKKHVSFGISQDHTNSDKLSSKLQKLGSPIGVDTSVDTMNIDQDIGSIVGNESSTGSASFLERLLEIEASYKNIRSVVDELIAQRFGEKI